MTTAPGDSGRSAGAGYGIGLAAFAAFLYLALIVCAFGVTSLVLDADVIPERDAGPLVGPTMVGVAVIASAVSMVTLAARPAVERVVGPALLAGVVVYALFLLSGALVYGLGAGEPSAILRFVLEHAGTAFAVLAGVLAGVVHLLFLLLLARHDAGGTTPHWGWEGDERE